MRLDVESIGDFVFVLQISFIQIEIRDQQDLEQQQENRKQRTQPIFDSTHHKSERTHIGTDELHFAVPPKFDKDVLLAVHLRADFERSVDRSLLE